MSGDLIKSFKHKLNKRCTNNQEEKWRYLKPYNIGKHTCKSQDGRCIYRQPNDTALPKKHEIHTALVEEIKQ